MAKPAHHSPAPVYDRLEEAFREKFNRKPTQVEIGKLVGHKQGSVSDWTKVGKYPKMAAAIELALKLDVCVEWILTGRGPKRPRPADETAQKLWDIWPSVPLSTRSELIGYAVGSIKYADTDDPRKNGPKSAAS